MRQVDCTLESNESGRILDRLAGLENIVSAEAARKSLQATGRIGVKSCKLTHEVMVWVVLAMGILTDMPLQQVFKHSRRLRKGETTPGRAALCMARQRLGLAPILHLFRSVARPLADPQTPGGFYKGMRLMGIDATIYDVPDSEANDRAFGRSTGGRGDGAWPQVRKLSLVELGTHAEVAIVLKGIRCSSERKMLPGLLPYLPEDSLLLWDRGFFSYEIWKEVSPRTKLLARVTSEMILEPIEELSDGSYRAKIYRNHYDRQRDRNGLLVRVIKYTLDDPQRTGHQEEHTLLTNLLDAELYPAAELIPLYHERWEHELTFDEQKVHQDPPRPTKPAHLRSQTPAGVIQELYALSLGHFVTRALMFEAAQEAGIDPDRLSFTGCFQILQCRLPECESRTPESFSDWYEAVLWEMAQAQIEPRRNRINPRVIKRKMSKWPKKRPKHRRLPPLQKTFMETVVMRN